MMDFISQAQKIAIFDYLNEIGQITPEAIQEAEKRTKEWGDRISLDDILDTVSEVLFVPVKDIESPSKNFHISFARKCYYYIARGEGYIYSDIGPRVNRDKNNANQMVNMIRSSLEPGPAQNTYMLAALLKIQQVLAEKK